MKKIALKKGDRVKKIYVNPYTKKREETFWVVDRYKVDGYNTFLGLNNEERSRNWLLGIPEEKNNWVEKQDD